MRDSFRAVLRSLAALAFALSFGAAAQAPITLHGAVQFDDSHPFNKALLKFQELTAKYYGKPIKFVLHRNSELGLEKDYFAYMNQGISVDYAHRLAGAHVDVRQGGAAARHAVPVPRPRPLEQGARFGRVPADRRRRGQEGGRDDHRLRRRRHAQHHRQQAGAQHGRIEGPVDARDGRADPDADVRRDRREAHRSSPTTRSTTRSRPA